MKSFHNPIRVLAVAAAAALALAGAAVAGASDPLVGPRQGPAAVDPHAAHVHGASPDKAPPPATPGAGHVHGASPADAKASGCGMMMMKGMKHRGPDGAKPGKAKGKPCCCG